MLFSERLGLHQPSCQEVSFGEPGIPVQRDTLCHIKGLGFLDSMVSTIWPNTSIARER